ncbi:MAG: 5-dehydro-2-deoxygluconokinase [Alphaproteobacteria bacterium]|nr:MAG: 5-dehydro-2-deoxygluconokinase [Alphaproteobacteria bacterium]
MTARTRPLDVICMGRAGVDLYGEQVGGRLEDMSSFAKYVGGCPTNIAVGTARMGLRSALLSRVGDEHMGRFIRETLEREGVDISHVRTDHDRLTALVILGIRDRETFPLIFYRENCADMALCADDVDADFIASSELLLITGTHLSTDGTRAATEKAVAYARAAGTRVVLDIDYRPVLWGLTGKGLGEERFVASDAVTRALSGVLADCDMIVGTEEEFHIAGGTTDTMAALAAIRARSAAALVLKLGPDGCVVFPDAIPDTLAEGILVPGFPVEVFNVLGAGDAFMSGLLAGYVRGRDWVDCCRLANASGALVVSRHGCAPAIPSLAEALSFIEKGSPEFSLRKDAALEQLHWSTTRTRRYDEVLAFAFDHRKQLEDMATAEGADTAAVSAFKMLCLQAFDSVRKSRPDRGFGILCDGRLGEDTLARVSGTGAWIGRPVEYPGSRPLRFEGGPSLMAGLREWPQEHCVKCLVFYHPDDTAEVRAEQEAQVLRLAAASRATGHELLIEIIPPATMPRDSGTICRVIERFYALGIYPDWWKLPTPLGDSEWRCLADTVRSHDPYCRGILLLGLDAPEAEVAAAIAQSARHGICRGFAVGRTIFGDVARAWFAGNMDDDAATEEMAARYGRLVDVWTDARQGAEGKGKASA